MISANIISVSAYHLVVSILLEFILSTDRTIRRQPRAAAKQASMADVAQAAGVSMITVSRMLKQPELVAESTRRRIEQAMHEVGYVPNLIAGGLAANHTQLVAVIVPYIHHGVFADAVQALSDALTAQGYCVLLGNSGGSTTKEEMIVRTLLGHRPAGLVIQGANHTEQTRHMLERANIPVVEMGTLPDNPIDMAVGYSNKAAALHAIEHLVSTGRRRIGFIGHASGNNDRHAQRLMGYKTGLERASMPFEPALIEKAEFTISDGTAAFLRLLDRFPEMDAVFCSSDLWAAGAVFECQRKGISVPEMISICGFNDQEIASQMTPQLTTIRVRREEIGTMAAQLILTRLSGDTPAQDTIDVSFELMLRGTTK